MHCPNYLSNKINFNAMKQQELHGVSKSLQYDLHLTYDGCTQLTFLYVFSHTFLCVNFLLLHPCVVVRISGFVREVRTKSVLYVFVRKNMHAFGMYIAEKIGCPNFKQHTLKHIKHINKQAFYKYSSR